MQRVTSRNVYDVQGIPLLVNADDDDAHIQNFVTLQEHEVSYIEVQPNFGDNIATYTLHRSGVQSVHVSNNTPLQKPPLSPKDEDFIDDEDNEVNSNQTISSEHEVTDSETSFIDGMQTFYTYPPIKFEL